MIDRSYLPYQSAREFQDRGMAKWAGFFLSEHTTALHTKEIDRSQLTILPLAEQIQLLEQAFQQQTTISITILEATIFRLTQVRFTPYLLLSFFSKAMATTTVSS